MQDCFFNKMNRLTSPGLKQTAVIFYFLIFGAKPNGIFRFLTECPRLLARG